MFVPFVGWLAAREAVDKKTSTRLCRMLWIVGTFIRRINISLLPDFGQRSSCGSHGCSRATQSTWLQHLRDTTLSLPHRERQSPWRQWSVSPGVVVRFVRRGTRLRSGRCHCRSAGPVLLRTACARVLTFSCRSRASFHLGSRYNPKEHDSGQSCSSHASPVSSLVAGPFAGGD